LGHRLGQTTGYAYDDLNRLLITKYPDGYNETRTYDTVGNLQSRRDPNGNTINYSYDTLNRLTVVTYPDSSAATYTYDKNNNRVALSYGGNSANFNYDARNRLVKETWTIGGTQSSLTYSYDSAGNLVRLVYPDNTVISYSIDPMNDITAVKVGSTTLANVTYSNGNRISSIGYGNGVRTTYGYDSRSRLIRMTTVNNTSTLLDLVYAYDSTNNVVGINGETYSYDYLNRLTNASGPWGVTQYGYDGVGNRVWIAQPGNTTYSYGLYNRLTSAGSNTYTYDNNGNLKTSNGGAYSYFFDYENRLTQIKQSSSTIGTYVYSPLGQRIQKIENSITTVYMNRGLNVLFEKQVTGGTAVSDYVYNNGLLIAKLSGGSTYYFHTDMLGSIRLVTMGSSPNFSTNYRPFGVQYGVSGTDPTYKYSGKPQDGATGLYYYAARYYDPDVGRFISRDPAGLTLSDPQSLGIYSYARNNPETFIDPTGKGAYCCGFNWLVRQVVKSAAFLVISWLLCCYWSVFGQPSLFFWILAITTTVLTGVALLTGWSPGAFLAFIIGLADEWAQDYLKPRLPWWLQWLAGSISWIVVAAGYTLLGYWMYSVYGRIRPQFGARAFMWYWGIWIAVDFAVEFGFDYFGWFRDF